MSRLLNGLACIGLLALAPAASADEDDAQLLALLRSGGQIVLMRHTVTTPGVGDPPGMTLTDCATQRNLTDDGRRDAKAIGERLKAADISFEHVAASPLCRCKDTATLAFGRLDEVQMATTRGDREVREMRAFAAEKRRGNAVLVSHGTTIEHAVGVHTDPGDMLVITPHGSGNFQVRGRIKGVK